MIQFHISLKKKVSLDSIAWCLGDQIYHRIPSYPNFVGPCIPIGTKKPCETS